MTPAPYYADDLTTLYCGDCTDPDIAAIWTQATALITDPPYGIAYTGIGGYSSEGLRHSDVQIAGDHSTQTRDTMLSFWTQQAQQAQPALLFGSWRAPRPPQTRHRLIWHKAGSAPGPSRCPFLSNDEEIYILGGGWIHTSPPLRSVISTTEHRSLHVREVGHPTPKPIGLMETLIRRLTPHDDMLIADPFAGSGSTLLAARRLGIRSIGVELRAEYCDLIVAALRQDILPLTTT